MLVLAALLAWADADTPSLSVTRFALTVAVASGLGLAASYVGGGRPSDSPEHRTYSDHPPAEQQLSFSFSDET